MHAGCRISSTFLSWHAILGLACLKAYDRQKKNLQKICLKYKKIWIKMGLFMSKLIARGDVFWWFCLTPPNIDPGWCLLIIRLTRTSMISNSHRKRWCHTSYMELIFTPGCCSVFQLLLLQNLLSFYIFFLHSGAELPSTAQWSPIEGVF